MLRDWTEIIRVIVTMVPEMHQLLVNIFICCKSVAQAVSSVMSVVLSRLFFQQGVTCPTVDD